MRLFDYKATMRLMAEQRLLRRNVLYSIYKGHVFLILGRLVTWTKMSMYTLPWLFTMLKPTPFLLPASTTNHPYPHLTFLHPNLTPPPINRPGLRESRKRTLKIAAKSPQDLYSEWKPLWTLLNRPLTYVTIL